MDLKGIMLSEINQRKTNSAWYHLYVDSKNTPKQQQTKPPSSQIQRIDWWLPEVGDGIWAKWVKVVKRYKRPVIK